MFVSLCLLLLLFLSSFWDNWFYRRYMQLLNYAHYLFNTEESHSLLLLSFLFRDNWFYRRYMQLLNYAQYLFNSEESHSLLLLFLLSFAFVGVS